MLIKPWVWKKYCYGEISLCMIMRNEEKLLQRCLDSVKGLVDEIVIVDTGSSDRSVEIAKRNGAIVLFEKWNDDFAAPRNRGIENASKEWIFIMDPDEVIARKDHSKIRALTTLRGVKAVQIDTRNYTNNVVQQGFLPCRGEYVEEMGWKGWAASTKTRLFRNGCGLRFKGRWHELVDYTVDPKKHVPIKAVVPIHHFEHEINQGDMEKKKLFYLMMGEKKVMDDVDNDQAWWELAVAEGIMGYYSRAARSIRMSMRKGFYTANRLFAYVHVLKKIGDNVGADFMFEKAVCKLFPRLTHCEGVLRRLPKLDPHLERKIV